MPAPATRYDVFLSHNNADKAAVEEMARRLKQAGLRPWLDVWNLIPGAPWQEGIEEALSASTSVAVFVGPSGISPWHNEEMRDALDRAVRSRDDYRVIPVLLPGADEGSIGRFLTRRVWVDFRSGLDDEGAFGRLVAGIKGQAIEVGSYELPDEPAPYRGLLPFDQQHARFFFGRDADRQRLLERLAQHPFVAVVGASGSGKSSLVKAGLLSALDQNALPDSSQWRVLPFTPGPQPLLTLAGQLTTFLSIADRPRALDELVARLAERNDALRTTLLAYTADQQTPVLLIVDQFEEVFTLCQEGPERCRAQIEQFIANLADTVHKGNGRIRVLLTLRADFLDRCLAYPKLRELLEDRQLLLGPLDAAGLREAIVRPAGVVGALLEKGLVEILLRDVGSEPGMLPLLQQALYELWLRRRGPWLTLEAYQASGGVLGALQKRADNTYQALTQLQQEIARSIFLRLTALGEGAVDTRRRVHREELYPAGTDRSTVDTVLQALSSSQARLIVADESTAEVAHEALIQRWALLGRWLEENRHSLRVHRRLTEAAGEWEQNRGDESYLYQGSRLMEAQEWASAHSSEMNQGEQGFLAASLELRRREEVKKEAERQTRQRRARVLTALATALAILLIPASFIGVNAWMFVRRQDSDWQLTGFPSESALSIAVAGETEDPQVPRICVGASDIGIGCSYDLQNWNIYQIGLPTTTAALFNNRDSFLDNLTGSTWSTNIQGVEAIAFDRHDPHRLVASVVEGEGLFVSEDGGAHWRKLSAGASSPEGGTPTEARQVAAYGGALFVLRNSEAPDLKPEERGSLYLSHDDGRTWQRIGGPSTATGVLRSFALAAQGTLRGVYGAGESGLVWSPAGDQWQWQQLLPADNGDLGVVVAEAHGVVYLATYNKNTQRGAMYRWAEGDNTLTGRWVEFDEAPRSLALASHPDADYPVWVLFDNGQVVAIDRQGRLESRGHRPGWPWSFAKVLAAIPVDGGDIVLMGHRDGLLQYCPRSQQGDGCGTQLTALSEVTR